MEPNSTQGGVCKVTFLMFGIILIASIYKLIEGLIKDEFIDPLYIVVSSIGVTIYLISCLAHICHLFNKEDHDTTINIAEKI